VPQHAGNQIPNTPDVSEPALREMKVEQLREAARDEGLASTSNLRKEELVHTVAEARSGEPAGGEVGAASPGAPVAVAPGRDRRQPGPLRRLHARHGRRVPGAPARLVTSQAVGPRRRDS
jgi:hypothetical protein